jgi:hypothetical protein
MCTSMVHEEMEDDTQVLCEHRMAPSAIAMVVAFHCELEENPCTCCNANNDCGLKLGRCAASASAHHTFQLSPCPSYPLLE